MLCLPVSFAYQFLAFLPQLEVFLLDFEPTLD